MSLLPLTTRTPDAPALLHGGKGVTIGRFLARAEALARALPAGAPVVNLCRDRYAFSVTFAGTILNGGCNLLPPNRLKATVDDLIDRHRHAVVVADWELEGFRGRLVDPTSALACDGFTEHPPQVPEDQLAAVVFTSGSTGSASRIEKSWRTLYDSTRVNLAELAPPAGATLMATVPAQHMWGLETSVLAPWFGDLTVAASHPFFVDDIRRELEAVPAPRALVSTPVHLRALIESGVALPRIDRVYSATAPLSRALARRVEAAAGCELLEVYGCSETGCLARRRTATETDWTRFRAFTFDTEERATIARADHLPGPVRLMDHLAATGPGRFRLVGRESDLVNIAGKRASLTELTTTLLDIPGVLDGVIFQPPETEDGPARRLAALVVAPSLTPADIRRAFGRRVDPAFMPRPLRLVEQLPRAETGKLPRQSLLRFFAQTSRQAS